MKYIKTNINGVLIIKLEPYNDVRGTFARLWSAKEFKKNGLMSTFAEINMSQSLKRGTMRGLHWQEYPHEETKLLRCVNGIAYVVIVDMRLESATRYQYTGIELNSEEYLMTYTPGGCAHGYQSLSDDTEVIYGVSSSYVPESERGLRWDDPFFNIKWPIVDDIILSEKDSGWPDFNPNDHH